MAAGTYTPQRAKSATQGGSFVDTVTFGTRGDTLTLDNLSSSVGIWWTYSSTGVAPVPTIAGDDCIYLPPGAFRSYRLKTINQVALIGTAVGMNYAVAVI